MDYQISVATGMLLGMFYMLLGFGVARMLEKIKGAFSCFAVFFWPIALCVYAASGDISLGD